MARVPQLIEQNKGRRKYEAVEGLTRHQIYYRNNHASRSYQLDKDKRKRLKLIRMFGGRCVVCKYVDERALVLDHRVGDGYADRRRVGSKVARYYVLHFAEAVETLQVLCANCNLIKCIENNEHNRSRRVLVA